MKARRSFTILIFSLSIMAAIVTMVREQTAMPVPRALQGETAAANDNAPRLSPQRIRHILYGDHTGGGHLYGMKIPCKSEFPPGWSAEEIIASVQALAANDNMRWKQAENSYYTGEGVVGDVRIRVVLDREKDDIVTAYPLNRPRNACPAR